jgi:hypothetical protein
MDTSEKIRAMCDSRDGSFYLFNHYNGAVSAHFEIKKGTTQLLLCSDYLPLDEAVDWTYNKWRKLVDAMPEFAYKHIERTPIPDDEIPF